MSAIMGRYTETGDMTSGAELCLECADDFDWNSSSRERRDVTLLWIYGIHTCTVHGAKSCWTRDALQDEEVIWRYPIIYRYRPRGESGE